MRTDVSPEIAFFFIRGNPGDCWEWLGRINDQGYGVVSHRLLSGNKAIKAHRAVWTLEHGEVPEGFQLDHLCRRRSCVNPKHLDVVTGRINTLRGIGPTAVNSRKDTCPSGHSLEGVNVFVNDMGWRFCRTCRRERGRLDWHARRKFNRPSRAKKAQ